MESKKVQILRRPNNTRLPENVYALSKRRIGAYATANGVIKTGISREEEKKLLPYLLNVDFNSPEFLRRKEEYYYNITINVPLEGFEFEIGKDSNGMPLNIDHYIKFYFAKNHPWVAGDKEELNGSPEKLFYIYDKNKEKVEKEQILKTRKEAYKEFIKLSGDERRVEMIINMLGVNPDSLDSGEKEVMLEEEATKNPDKFLTIARDKKLEMKAFIKECISYEVLTLIGTSVLEGDEVIGNSMDEAVIKLEDKANSEMLARLKAKLIQFKK